MRLWQRQSDALGTKIGTHELQDKDRISPADGSILSLLFAQLRWCAAAIATYRPHSGRYDMISPLAYSIAEACAVGRTGRTALYEVIRKGDLRAIKRGRRTLILVDDLRQWLEGLPALSARRPE